MRIFNFTKYPAFSYHDFRLFWIGLFVSTAGNQMQIVAMNWHIYILTGSALALGLIGLMRFIPIVFFSLISGTIADAHNRKKILLITQTVQLFLALVLTIVTLTNSVNLILIYIITIASSAALSFEIPARQAILPSLVDRKHLTNAISLNSIMYQLSTIIGPSIAGFLIAGFGVGSIYLINTISFVILIGTLLLMKVSGKAEGVNVELSLTSVKEGFHFVRSKTIIWSTMMLDFFSTFFSSAIALLPIFAKEILAVGPLGLGFLYAAQPLGALIAGSYIAHIGEIKRQGKVLLASVILYGFATILFGLSSVFILSLFALMLVGVGDSISTIIRNTIRQLSTPDHIRGRMTAINMMFFAGGPQLGEFEAGAAAALLGARLSVVSGGIGTIVAAVVIGMTISKLRNHEVDTK